MSELRRAALYYASRGWRVFPCKTKGKTPLTLHGCHDATTDERQVMAWWCRWPEANIGIATGKASNLFAVDLDGDVGIDAWAWLEATHGPATTREQVTGGGGVHLLFTYPDGATLGNTAGKLLPSIDTRGQGGYILAAPSVHPSGRKYRWRGNHDPAPCPGWLVDLLTPPPRPIRAVAPLPERSRGDAYWLAALGGELNELASSPQGQRNHQLNRAAFRLGQLEHHGARLDVIGPALEQVALGIGLDACEVAGTIRSGWNAGARQPRRSA